MCKDPSSSQLSSFMIPLYDWNLTEHAQKLILLIFYVTLYKDLIGQFLLPYRLHRAITMCVISVSQTILFSYSSIAISFDIYGVYISDACHYGIGRKLSCVRAYVQVYCAVYSITREESVYCCCPKVRQFLSRNFSTKFINSHCGCLHSCVVYGGEQRK